MIIDCVINNIIIIIAICKVRGHAKRFKCNRGMTRIQHAQDMTRSYSGQNWTRNTTVHLVPQHTGGWSQHERVDDVGAVRKRGVSELLASSLLAVPGVFKPVADRRC